MTPIVKYVRSWLVQHPLLTNNCTAVPPDISPTNDAEKRLEVQTKLPCFTHPVYFYLPVYFLPVSRAVCLSVCHGMSVIRSTQ